MILRPFKQIDVFTARPFHGNPVAVVLDANGLGTDDMQRIAAWTNLSETTFVWPATTEDADYRLRIFTPRQELPFAGHPTIGSAHAVLESGLVKPVAGRLVQECGAGLLNLRVEGEGDTRCIFVQAPHASLRPIDATFHAHINTALGARVMEACPPLCVNIGPEWMVCALDDADAVNDLQPDLTAITQLSEKLHITGITVFGRTRLAEPALCVRSFAPACGVPEDPVCGSGNASVAVFLVQTGMLDSVGHHYVASQGRALGRDGRVFVRVNKEDLSVEIGGVSVTCVDGAVRA